MKLFEDVKDGSWPAVPFADPSCSKPVAMTRGSNARRDVSALKRGGYVAFTQRCLWIGVTSYVVPKVTLKRNTRKSEGGHGQRDRDEPEGDETHEILEENEYLMRR